MRVGTYEEIPRLKRLCLRHRLALISTWLEDEDIALSGTGVLGQGRREVLLKAVACRRCRSRNGLVALSGPGGHTS